MVQVAEKVGAHVTEVKNVIIWGNHSSSQFPDVAHGSVGGTPIKEAVKDEEWLKGDFITTVQQRGAAIIKVRQSRALQARLCTHCDTRPISAEMWFLRRPVEGWMWLVEAGAV